MPSMQSGTNHSLAPEQAQRLVMKLVKRFPALLEGFCEVGSETFCSFRLVIMKCVEG